LARVVAVGLGGVVLLELIDVVVAVVVVARMYLLKEPLQVSAQIQHTQSARSERVRRRQGAIIPTAITAQTAEIPHLFLLLSLLRAVEKKAQRVRHQMLLAGLAARLLARVSAMTVIWKMEWLVAILALLARLAQLILAVVVVVPMVSSIQISHTLVLRAALARTPTHPAH
jgi:hypothetical protein